MSENKCQISVTRLLRELPEGIEEACYKTKAMERKRGIKEPTDLLLLSMFHLLNGCSLMEISQIAKIAKLGEVSDVAFMKRFRNCREWFAWINREIGFSSPIEYQKPEKLKPYRILAIDGSDVREKGKSGRIYRLHYAYDIFRMEAAEYKLTQNDVGEGLHHFDLQEHDLVLADRGYCSRKGIHHCLERGADFLLRMRINSFTIYNEHKQKMDLLEVFRKKETGDLRVYYLDENQNLQPIRICYMRKSEKDIEKSRSRLKRLEVKKKRNISEMTYEFNDFIVLVTSLKDEITSKMILDLYRLRWQVEIHFKTLKSIMDYGELPKKTSESVFAWLNGKLMIALLIQKILAKESFPPENRFQKEFMEGI